VLPVNRRQTLPLVAALACLLGLVVVALLVLDVSAVRVRDRAILHGFVGLDRPSVHSEINVLAHLCDPLPYALAGLACVGVALARRRGWRSLAVLSLLVVTGATTQALKHVLAHPRFTEWLGTDNQISATAWPSGHSTAAMTLALCAVLVAPPAWRLAAGVVGGTFAVGVGYAVLVLARHFPSDVLGGFLVAGMWTSLAIAALHRVEVPEQAQRPAWEPLVALGGVAAAVAAAVIGTRSDDVAIYSMERPTLVAGALTIAVLALALVATVSVASTRTAAPRYSR
jgi:membrane-associated phospholipid phosphatase